MTGRSLSTSSLLFTLHRYPHTVHPRITAGRLLVSDPAIGRGVGGRIVLYFFIFFA
jgi:hypothetical protein